MKTIKKIVFTGGPCSGKTTFMSRAEEIFGERGYRVIIDNESATDLISGGISPATLGMYEFQKYVISLQLAKEEICYKAAQEIEGEKVLMFIDRALKDDESYVGKEDFCKIFADVLELDEVGATDNFFEIGGTSLVAMRVVMRAVKAGYKIVYKDVFDYPTPRYLAGLVNDGSLRPFDQLRAGEAQDGLSSPTNDNENPKAENRKIEKPENRKTALKNKSLVGRKSS